jgi:hypothetical protein
MDTTPIPKMFVSPANLAVVFAPVLTIARVAYLWPVPTVTAVAVVPTKLISPFLSMESDIVPPAAPIVNLV